MEKTTQIAKPVIRIAITGPESTGKTTVTRMLAEHFDAHWIPEYARTFLEGRKGKYAQSDLDIIAERQLAEIDKIVEGDLLLTDTEMLVMKIWSEFRYGRCSPLIDKFWREQQYDLYLLCNTDIPFQEDDLRENPNERAELFQLYKHALEEAEVSFVVLSGSEQCRLQVAVDQIYRLL